MKTKENSCLNTILNRKTTITYATRSFIETGSFLVDAYDISS